MASVGFVTLRTSLAVSFVRLCRPFSTVRLPIGTVGVIITRSAGRALSRDWLVCGLAGRLAMLLVFVRVLAPGWFVTHLRFARL